MDRKKWCRLIFAGYCLLMLWLLFGQRLGQGRTGVLQLQPFDTLRRFLWVLGHSTSAPLRRNAWINLAGNVVMFVPLGFLTCCIWRKMEKFYWHLPVMAAVIAVVELLQLVIGLGTCDVDDLLLNLMGTTVGFVIWKFLYKYKR